MANNEMALSERNEAAAVMTEAVSTRETAQIQAQMVIAQKCKRNELAAIERIMNDCRRPGLAEKAVYTYARGGNDISGPSIHLAKAIAKRWGNMMSGIVELEQRRGESVCEAYALDLETNYKESKIFTVPHIRYTKKGTVKLEDPRDIYELVANNGSRRERACILSVIPGDIVEDAVEECIKTMKTHADTSPENVKKMLDMFREKYGVTKTQIEKRIQRRIDAITPAQMVNLRNIYNSLKDGMSIPEEWFEPETAPETTAAPKTGAEKAAAALNKVVAPKEPAATASAPADDDLSDFAPMISAEISKSGAPVTVDGVLEFVRKQRIALTMDSDFGQIVNLAAEAELV